jgi:Na+-transporting methylmalonyl-CoA/oxaloacetate decarboxylase gamma subunit
MEKFANPDLIGSLTFGEKMSGSFITMIMGIGITFTVLVILWAVIVGTTKVFAHIDKKGGTQQGNAEPAVESAVETDVNMPVAQGLTEVDGSVPVAAIIAAIMAFESESGGSSLFISRISRVSGQPNAWNSAGRADCINSRMIF